MAILKWIENAWWCIYRPLVSACLLTVGFHGVEYDSVCRLEHGTVETGREFLFVGICCFLPQGRLYTASHLATQQYATKSGFANASSWLCWKYEGGPKNNKKFFFKSYISLNISKT